MKADSDRSVMPFTLASKKFPPTVYKYRVWETPKHRTILTDRQVWFAAPSTFNDPLDCKNPTRYDILSDKELSQVYLNSSKEENPNFSRQQHRAYVRKWLKKTSLRDKDYLKEMSIKDNENLNNFLGVLSLTANPANKAMWETYSQSHTGFVVGFNSQIAFQYFGGGGKVEYVDQLPIIKPRPFNDFMEQARLKIYFKHSKWASEDEYRLQKSGFSSTYDENRKIVLPVEAFSEIVFGAQINQTVKSEIIAIIKNTMSHIKLRQAQLNGTGEVAIYNES